MTGLSLKQYEAIQRSEHRINIWDGAIRSGKTLSSVIAWLDFCRYGPPGPLAMIGKTHQTLSRNVIDVIDELHPRAVNYTRGAPTARVMGRLVHIFGANNAAAEGKIRGLTLAGAYLDEATLVSEQFFAQTLGRLSVPGAKLFATTNPDSPRHWLMEKYLKRADELDLRRHVFHLSDNPSLTREYVRSISLEFTGLFYRRFILGEWTGADGAVFDNWQEGEMTLSSAEVPHIDRVLIAGLDYGTVHATRAYLLGMATVWSDPFGNVDWTIRADTPGYRKRAVLIVLDEFAPDTGTVGQHARGFMNWLSSQPEASWTRPEWIAYDPAAATFGRELFDMGVSNVIPAHKSVLAGIQTMQSLMSTRSLYVVGDRCPQLLEGLPNYLWDAKAADRGKTIPVKESDDEVDALRYAVYTSRDDWRGRIPLAPVVDFEAEEAA